MVLDRKAFHYFLFGALFIHAAMMSVHLRDHFQKSVETTAPIKVKLADLDTIRKMATIQKKQIVQSEDSDIFFDFLLRNRDQRSKRLAGNFHTLNNNNIVLEFQNITNMIL